MYKLLILDDEPIILDGLTHILDWNEIGFEIVGTASDGVEGLLEIREHAPDFVITDIRMKFMDGLTFIKEAQAIQPDLVFVVISAFSDFEYAKQSIGLGVFSYILKPIDRQELLRVVCGVREEIDHLRLSSRQVKQMKEVIQDNRQSFIERFIQSLFLGSFTAEELDKKREQMNIPFENSNDFIAIILKVNLMSQKDMKGTHRGIDSITMYSVRNIVEEVMGSSCSHCIVDHGKTQLALLAWSGSFDKQQSTQLEKTLHQIRTAVRTYLKLTVSIARGNKYIGFSGIQQSYAEARHALEYSLIAGNDVYVDAKIMEAATINTPMYPQEIEEKIIEDIHFQDLPGLHTDLSRFIDVLRGSNSYIFTLTALYQLFSAIVRKVGDIRMFDLNGDIQSFLKEMNQKTTDEINDTIYSLCANYIFHTMGTDSPSVKKIIREAITFVKKNMSNPELSVKMVADQLQMNATYFGQMFKKDLVKTFNEYVTDLRVEEAKKLLSSHETKVYEIADQVGFNNTHYFNVVFKKMTGMTPNEFRNHK